MASPQTSGKSDGDGLRFFPVSVESLSDSELEMDLYIRHGSKAEPVLFRAVGLQFTPEDRAGLLRNTVEHLYIRTDQHRLYRKMLNGRLESVFLDSETESVERARFVRSACSRMIEDVFLLPGNTEAIESVVDVSKRFTSWSDSDPHTFGYLLDMSAHDYLTLTHMVTVGVGCGMLVKEMRPGDPDLMATAIQGGLLHDIGKRGLPTDLLNKEGKLSPQEWELLQRHPQIGFDELKSNAGVPQVVLDMTRDHHERLDGRGYPRGVGGGLIGFAARVCAVVDVFDALSAARPYRGAIHPLEVLKIMTDGAGSQFDGDILAVWSRIVRRILKEDPQRAPAADFPAAPQGGLDALCPKERFEGKIATSSATLVVGKAERRRFERFPCPSGIQAAFVHQGKSCPVLPGEVFDVRTLDLSKGGMCVEAPFPFSLNDVLILILPTKDGITLRRHVRCVRVRNRNGKWQCGLCFVSEAELSQNEGGASERAA